MIKHGEKEKIKSNIKEKTNLILFLLFCVLTLTITVGYAALNQELNISGEASFRVEEEIRITNVELLETTNLALENYTSKYGKDSITLGVSLPNIESTVKYKVEIINSGTVSMWIDSITQDTNNNTNMEYYLEGLGVRELINPGETKVFNLTIKYKDGITLPSNTSLDTMLRFNFVKPTSTLASGNSAAATSTFFNSGSITKESVESIEFLPTLEVGEGAIGYWDASASKNGTVIAWYTDNDNNDLYELNIGGVGEVYAPNNSNYLFYVFTNLNSIDFSKYFNTSNVTSMSNMFSGCSSLSELNLNHFDTSNVTDMAQMFYDCRSLTELDLNHFDTSNVTNLNSIFWNCESLTELNVDKWNTENVTNSGSTSYGMFTNCASLTTLDLSNWNTSKMENMIDMFNGCCLLEKLDIRNFSFESVTNSSDMFNNVPNNTSIYVKDEATKNFIIDLRSDFTDIQIYEEV